MTGARRQLADPSYADPERGRLYRAIRAAERAGRRLAELPACNCPVTVELSYFSATLGVSGHRQLGVAK